MEVCEIRSVILPDSSLLGPLGWPRPLTKGHRSYQVFPTSLLMLSSELRHPQQTHIFWKAIPPSPTQGEPHFPELLLCLGYCSYPGGFLTPSSHLEVNGPHCHKHAREQQSAT